MGSVRKRGKKASKRRASGENLTEARQAKIRKSETIEITGVVRADRVVAQEILLVDRANHRRVLLFADGDRTVITLHDLIGQKLVSLVASGKDEPVIDLYRHDTVDPGIASDPNSDVDSGPGSEVDSGGSEVDSGGCGVGSGVRSVIDRGFESATEQDSVRLYSCAKGLEIGISSTDSSAG